MSTTVACTDLYLRHYNDDGRSGLVNSWWKDYSSSETISAYAGYDNTTTYGEDNIYTTILKFKTPSFTGISDSIEINLNVVIGGTDSADSMTLNWALCTSDANKNNYISTDSAPTDSYRIKKGTKSFSGLTENLSSYKINISSSEVKSNTTYYFFLWPSSSSANAYLQLYRLKNQSVNLVYATACTVSYNANGGTGAPASQKAAEGKAIFLSDTIPTRESSTTSSTFTITGNVNGGDGSNKKITATEKVTTSYTFLGWGTSASDTTVDYEPGDLYNNYSSITLYAIWESEESTTYSNNSISKLAEPERSGTSAEFTVTLNANGGSVSNTSLTATATGSYTFKGWGKTADSTTPLDNDTTYTSATTVYAIWNDDGVTTTSVTLPTPTRADVEEQFTVTFDPDNGDDPTDITTHSTTSYTFLGWGTSSTSTTYVSSPYKPNKNITLYAIWKTVTNTNPVSIADPEDFESSSSTYYITLNCAEDTSIHNTTIEVSAASSYTFLGWGTSKDSTKFISMPYTPTENITLYAIWEGTDGEMGNTELPTPVRENTVKYCTITLDTTNGGTLEESTCKASIITNYVFAGWSTSRTYRNFVSSPYTPTNMTTTLYGMWDLEYERETVELPVPEWPDEDGNTYTITFEPEGGTLDTTTISRTQNISHIFRGWGKSATSTSGLVTSYTPTSISNTSVTLYAIWRTTTSIGGIELPTPARDQEVETLTVTLDPNEESIALDPLKADKTSVYTFNGWKTAGDIEVSSPYAPTASLTLYGMWDVDEHIESVSLPVIAKGSSVRTFVITLDPNNGIVETDTLEADKTTSYKFNGWETDANVVVSSPYTPSDNITLYGVWESNESTESVTLPIPKKDGYTFLGWTEDMTAAVYVPTVYTPDGSTTLYAMWSANGVVYINGKAAIVYVYHNGKFQPTIPLTHSNGSYIVCS